MSRSHPPRTPNARRPGPLVAHSSAAFGVAAVQAIVVPFVALQAVAFGVSPAGIGVLVSTGLFVPVFVATRIGRWVDRYGVRRVVVAALVAFAGGAVPFVLAPSVPTLFLLAVAVNLGHVAGIVATQRGVADAPVSRESAYGWFTMTVSVGQLVGPVVMGVVFDAWSGQGVAAVVVASSLLFAVASTVMVPRRSGTPAAPGDLPQPPPVSPWRAWAAKRGVRIAVLGSGAALFALSVHQTFYPVALESLHLSASTIGAILSVRAAASLVVRPFLQRAVQVAGSRAYVYVAALLMCAVGVATPFTSAPVVLAVVASALLGMGGGFAQPLSMVVLAEQVAPRVHGAFLGVRMAVNYASVAVATALVGALLARYGAPVAFAFAATLPLVLAILVARARRHVDAAPAHAAAG